MTEIQSNVLKKGLSDYLSAKTLILWLFLLIFFGLLLGNGLTVLIFQLKGYSLAGILESDPATIDASKRNLLRAVTFLNHTFTFLLPAFLLAWLLEKKQWKSFLSLNKAPLFQNTFSGVLMILISVPIVGFLIWVNQQIPLPDLFKAWESSAESTLLGLVKMETVVEFGFSLIVMAVLPALGEELVFRGILQKNLEKTLSSPHLAIWIGAFIFSAFHFQFMGFLPRLFLGLILGYLFFWTKNLWVPILAHLFYNGMQVITIYISPETFQEPKTEIPAAPQLGITLISTIFVAYLGYSIWKNNLDSHRERAPEENDFAA